MRKANHSILLALFSIILTMGAIRINDPTRPPLQSIITPETTAIPPITQLTAIFISRKKRIAVINGQIYSLGDHIGQFTITAIKPYSVELIGPNEMKELLRLATPIKRRSIYKDPCVNG